MSSIPRVSLITMVMGLGLLVFGGLLGISMLWQGQGIGLLRVLLPYTDSHWFIMVYGFFLALIGNEILVVLSMEWSGRPAILDLQLFFLIMLASSITLRILGLHYLSYVLTALAFLPLVFHVKTTYLKSSILGLKPTLYNYLILTTLIITVGVILYAAYGSLNGVTVYVPIMSLVFPVGTILAILVRDLSLITGVRVSVPGYYHVLMYSLVIIGVLSMPTLAYTQYSIIPASLIIMGSIMAILGSGLLRAKTSRPLSIIELYTAFSWLMASGTLIITAQLTNKPWDYVDAFIHSITLGFLFNVIFGVDVILTDWLLAYGGRGGAVTVRVGRSMRRSIPKALILPYMLLNLGVALRVIYDIALIPWAGALTGVLSGLGILAFLGYNMGRVVINQAPWLKLSKLERP